MCACRQKKSFLIDDILHDPKKKIVKKTHCDLGRLVTNKDRKRCDDGKTEAETNVNGTQYNEKEMRFSAITEVQREMDLSNFKVNLEQRRNTYPIYPTAVKPMVAWPRYRLQDTVALSSEGQRGPHPFSFYSDPTLNTDHNILRSQLAANTYGSFHHPLNGIGQTYGFDRVHHTWCNPWWGVGGRRKGGQVRFSAAQTSALERRFSSSIYLSPDERRAFAASLRLSDRQVKTWFQNRRAKWRRTTPDVGGSNSPEAGKASDDES